MIPEILALWDRKYVEKEISLDREPFLRKVPAPVGDVLLFYSKSREARLRPQFTGNECCWLGEAEPISNLSETDLKVAFNTFPYHRGSLLLITPEHREDFREEDLESWFRFETRLEQENSQLRSYLFWNIKGSGASLVEHLHAQVVFIDHNVDLWVERADKKLVTPFVAELEYPMFCLSVNCKQTDRGISQAFRILKIFDKEFNVAFNIGISRGEIRIFPRRSRTNSEVATPLLQACTNKSLYTDKISGSEVSGLCSTTNQEIGEIFRTAPDQRIVNLFCSSLKAISFLPEQREKFIDLLMNTAESFR